MTLIFEDILLAVTFNESAARQEWTVSSLNQ